MKCNDFDQIDDVIIDEEQQISLCVLDWIENVKEERRQTVEDASFWNYFSPKNKSHLHQLASAKYQALKDMRMDPYLAQLLTIHTIDYRCGYKLSWEPYIERIDRPLNSNFEEVVDRDLQKLKFNNYFTFGWYLSRGLYQRYKTQSAFSTNIINLASYRGVDSIKWHEEDFSGLSLDRILLKLAIERDKASNQEQKKESETPKLKEKKAKEVKEEPVSIKKKKRKKSKKTKKYKGVESRVKSIEPNAKDIPTVTLPSLSPEEHERHLLSAKAKLEEEIKALRVVKEIEEKKERVRLAQQIAAEKVRRERAGRRKEKEERRAIMAEERKARQERAAAARAAREREKEEKRAQLDAKKKILQERALAKVEEIKKKASKSSFASWLAEERLQKASAYAERIVMGMKAEEERAKLAVTNETDRDKCIDLSEKTKAQIEEHTTILEALRREREERKSYVLPIAKSIDTPKIQADRESEATVDFETKTSLTREFSPTHPYSPKNEPSFGLRTSDAKLIKVDLSEDISISYEDDMKVLMESIKLVGVEKIQDLFIVVNGKNIIDYYDPSNQDSNYLQIDETWAVRKIGNRRLILSILKDISELLNLNLEISLA
ncbi:MAG: cell envelope integrity protein TolA [Rikenellaceae bacterium]|nr:cell envelope integrity protein TolA [Rikenellaceae bacterium]